MGLVFWTAYYKQLGLLHETILTRLITSITLTSRVETISAFNLVINVALVISVLK